MKILSALLSLSLFIFILSLTANAALIDNGDGTITDTDKNLMWLQDANYAKTSGYYLTLGYSWDTNGKMTWDDAVAWADSLVYAGFDDWRLPSALNSDGSGPCGFGYNCIDSEMGHLYYTELGNSSGSGGFTKSVPFANLQAADYWSGTVYAPEPTAAWDFRISDGYQGLGGKTGDEYAWAVRVVPEPISAIFFIIGGALLAGRRYLKSMKGI
jgi:hypothetical protein